MNMVTVAILVAPGYLLSKLAEAVETRRWASGIRFGIGLTLSVGAAVLIFYVARMRGQEGRQENNRTREYKVSAVRVMDGSGTMYADTNYYVTLHLRSVGNDGIPERIKLGDTIKVRDRSLTVNHIFVTEILEDMSYGGKVFARKGTIRCLLIEKLEDMPGGDDNPRNRQWINITDCKPEAPLN